MTALPPREGYRLWAPTYDRETAVSALENHLVADLGVPTAGARLLDAGCGTGRRLGAAGAALAAGVDATVAMLARAPRGLHAPLAAADVVALPFRAATFDVVWCRLVLGHLAEAGLAAAYGELARVCRPGGAVVVTDFHSAAAAEGHRRNFRDAAGAVHELEHHVHSPERHVDAALAAGLVTQAQRDGAVGPLVRDHYERAGRLDLYDAQRGLPIVLAFAFRRD